jgi:hypothetical protein
MDNKEQPKNTGPENTGDYTSRGNEQKCEAKCEDHNYDQKESCCSTGIFTKCGEDGQRKICGWVWAAGVVAIIGALGIITSAKQDNKTLTKNLQAENLAKLEEQALISSQVRAMNKMKAEKSKLDAEAKAPGFTSTPPNKGTNVPAEVSNGDNNPLAAATTCGTNNTVEKQVVKDKKDRPELNFKLEGSSHIKVFVDKGNISYVEIFQTPKDKSKCDDKEKKKWKKKDCPSYEAYPCETNCEPNCGPEGSNYSAAGDQNWDADAWGVCDDKHLPSNDYSGQNYPENDTDYRGATSYSNEKNDPSSCRQ